MNYRINVRNPGNHICNPLLKLKDREYATREEACEAIYDALYEVIDGENGCEMVDKPADLNTRGANFYVAKIKYYGSGWIETSRMGGVWVVTDHEDNLWQRVNDCNDDGLPMTYGEAVAKITRLDDERPYHLAHGEMGAPDYIVIDARTYDWLRAGADKYNYNDETEHMSDDELGAWMYEQDEAYVRDHAIEDEDDACTADDEANNRWHDWYINKCHTYILREGYAREDGVTASVEEAGQ